MSEEECAPIDTIENFYNYMKNPPEWGNLTVSISKRSNVGRNQDLHGSDYPCHFLKRPAAPTERFQYGTLPKTLVCHDMKNGYHEDRFIDGVNDNSCYLFYHWAAIDMFVYFSHHFITIPPLGWINIAHKHGVQILGTIITEWDEGKKICKELLQSEYDMHKFADELVSIAKYFKMDGWLLNIENPVENPMMLLKFVKYLTDKMHSAINGSVVIWYDSVTIDGKLAWQDTLNNKNKQYFDRCDGIFLNYCWTSSHLEESIINAGNRKHDVYVGIDVWGRNFYGGGRFNTAEAVKVIHRNNLSMAIFAPGWTHEGISFPEILSHSKNTKQIISPEELESCYSNSSLISSNYKCIYKEYFLLRESALWNTIWPYLNTRGPINMPFHTFFCLGFGEKRRYAGDVIKDGPWFNLREQQYQITNPICKGNFILSDTTESSQSKVIVPRSTIENNDVNRENSTRLHEDIIFPTDTSINEVTPGQNKPPTRTFSVKWNSDPGCMRHYFDDSYNGGGCLKICPKTPHLHDNIIENKSLMRLLMCEFHCDFNFILYCIVKSKNSNTDQDLNMVLTIQKKTEKQIYNVILCNENATVNNLNDATYLENNKVTYLKPVDFNQENSKTLKKNILSTHPQFWVDPDNNSNWKVRYYNITCPNSVMLNIDCELINDFCPVLLGGLGVCKDIVQF